MPFFSSWQRTLGRFLAVLITPMGLTGAAEAAAAKKPNILWLVGENLAHDLGAYGAKNVHTPHLDRLAAEGVRYTNVFATNPACAPSRSAFFTGMYQTTTDTHPMRSHRNDGFRLPEGVRPITHRLRDAGYFTANLKTLGGQEVGTGKLDLNFVNEGPIYDPDSSDWAALPKEKPFFAVVNALESEYDIYDRQTWKRSRVEWVGEREHAKIATPANVTPPPYYPDHPVVREEWARYLNSVSGMDQRFGLVLAKLRAEGREEDTIIVFFGDNGRLEPRGIHWCYDSGLRVPLIIRWPKNFPAPPQFSPGSVNAELISLIDLTATTLYAAGVPRPALMQGHSFLGERSGPPRTYVFAARDRIDETEQRIRSVHDKRFHYIRTLSAGPTFASLNRYKEKCFPILPLMRQLLAEGKLTGAALDLMKRRGPSEELYDLQADPHEIQDLAESNTPEHREALARLRAALDTWMVETGDRGDIPEPREVVAPFAQEMHDWFGTPAWAKYNSAHSPP
jgi:N-sulfoglucosamine sulfohydrolase